MKIYLAKSNEADPELVKQVADELTKLGYEVCRFKGGNYSHDLLLSCDKLIIVPAVENYAVENYVNHLDGVFLNKGPEISVGKGLIEEVITFADKKILCDWDNTYSNDILCFYQFDRIAILKEFSKKKGIKVSAIYEAEKKLDSSDWRKAGFIRVDDEQMDAERFFGKSFIHAYPLSKNDVYLPEPMLALYKSLKR